MCALIDADDLADLDDTERLQKMLTRAERLSDTRVAITGLGAVTPVGNDAETTWQALRGRPQRRRPDHHVRRRAPSRCRSPGWSKDFDLGGAPARPDRRQHLSRAGGLRRGGGAARRSQTRAWTATGTYEPHERGVAMGGSVGRAELQELVDMSARAQVERRARAAPRSRRASVLDAQPERVERDDRAARRTREGPMIGVSTACTASAHAIGEAFRRIQEGDAKMMIAGGYDALTTWFDVIGFGLLGALTKELQRRARAARRGRSTRTAPASCSARARSMAVLEELESATGARRRRSYARDRRLRRRA